MLAEMGVSVIIARIVVVLVPALGESGNPSGCREASESLEDRLKPRAAVEHTYAVVTRITRRELSHAFQKLGLKPKSKPTPRVW